MCGVHPEFFLKILNYLKIMTISNYSKILYHCVIITLKYIVFNSYIKVPILQCHFERHIHHSSPQLTKLSKGTTLGMTAAHYVVPNALFAVAESFKGMNEHVLKPNG